MLKLSNHRNKEVKKLTRNELKTQAAMKTEKMRNVPICWLHLVLLSFIQVYFFCASDLTVTGHSHLCFRDFSSSSSNGVLYVLLNITVATAA